MHQPSLALQKRLIRAFLGMQAMGVKMHLESLALGAVQTIKHRSSASRVPGWPINSEPNAPYCFRGTRLELCDISSVNNGIST
jgi:hypothetical protein